MVKMMSLNSLLWYKRKLWLWLLTIRWGWVYSFIEGEDHSGIKVEIRKESKSEKELPPSGGELDQHDICKSDRSNEGA